MTSLASCVRHLPDVAPFPYIYYIKEMRICEVLNNRILVTHGGLLGGAMKPSREWHREVGATPPSPVPGV